MYCFILATYDEARKKLLKSTNISESDVPPSSDAEGYGRSKRKHFLKHLTDSDSEEENQDLLANVNKFPSELYNKKAKKEKLK